MPKPARKFLSYSTDTNPGFRELRRKTQRRRLSAQHRQNITRWRAIIGQQLPLAEAETAGADSFPGPDVTFNPGPNFATTPIVNLGCLNSSTLTDLFPVGINWPLSQATGNLTTGTDQPGVSTTTGSIPGVGEVRVPGLDAETASRTPFQATVTLLADLAVYSRQAIAGGYSSVTLSQEGVLWTLWPLAKPEVHETLASPEDSLYFDQFVMGTSRRSNYPIGQLGFFINNEIMGYIPIANRFILPQQLGNPDASNSAEGLNDWTSEVLDPGVQGYNQTFIMTTEQQLALVVVKVAEEVARIYNPVAGASSEQRYLYVGYDAWAVVYTSANPMGPVAAETYVSPRPTTTVGENYQVVFPPNFPQAVYYKNKRRNLPVPEPMSIDGVMAASATGTPFLQRNPYLQRLQANRILGRLNLNRVVAESG